MVKEYYSITTKKFRLRTNHDGWLTATRNLYNEVLGFYYELFLNHEEIYDLSSQNSLRALEQLSVVGRDKKPVSHPLPWKKIPLYFRRAAINEAIAAAKSYLSRDIQDVPTKTFNAGVTFYKGMYRELTSDVVSIKVYDGEKWRWLHCRLSGNSLPEDMECMSPKLVFKDKHIEFHVPVRYMVSDGRKLKERIDENLRICSLQFMNNDALVVCCVLNSTGDICHVQFIRGGYNYQACCKTALSQIEKSLKVTNGQKEPGMNRRHWKKLQNISDNMAHQVSREILKICQENGASVLILPRYSRSYSRMIMASVGKWSPLRLSRRIIDQLNYKAWKNGMLVVEVEASDIGRLCAICGADIQKSGEEFTCFNGHKGNRHVNSARNLGKKFLKNMMTKSNINNREKDMP